MMPRLTILLLAGAAAGVPADGAELTPFGQSFESQGFERIAGEDGVQVYKDDESEILRLAAEGRVAAPPSQVRQALLAYEAQPGVIERVSETRILSRGEDRILVYQRLNLPVIDDRDYTLWVCWGEGAGVEWIRYRLAPHRGPGRQPGAVRVPHHQGSWQLRPINGGRATLLRYQVSIDMGGWVPRWMIKAAAGDEVPGVYRDICRLLAAQGKEPSQCLL